MKTLKIKIEFEIVADPTNEEEIQEQITSEIQQAIEEEILMDLVTVRAEEEDDEDDN